MTRVLVFAGTVEGRRLAGLLGAEGVRVHACVATGYGGELMEPVGGVSCSVGGMGPEVMSELMGSHPIVVDATHPYASRITGRIREACALAGAEYIRLLRPGTPVGDAVVVGSIDEAVGHLEGTEGGILVTTGSRDIRRYARIAGRVHARVLPDAGSIAACVDAGIPRSNIIAMQGPFSEELNLAMLRQTGVRHLVTKDSGREGGTDAKLAAAARAGVSTVLIGRPSEETGLSYDETVALLADRLGLTLGPAAQMRAEAGAAGRRVTLVGIGMGPAGGMTGDAREAIAAADLVVGAPRMIAAAGEVRAAVLEEYAADRVIAHLRANPVYREVAVLVSGDVGFHSAASKMAAAAAAEGFEVRSVCGISSLAHLCSRLLVPWEDVRTVSLHGRGANAVGEVRRNRRTFFLLEGAEGARRLCAQLARHCPDVSVTLGQDLGAADESIVAGRPADVAGRASSALCVALVDNPHPRTGPRLGIDDGGFSRGGAPMTKSEVRALSLLKLELDDDSVVHDIGAGTGSVAVEAALTAVSGHVHAVERDPEALALIAENAERFGVTNLTVTAGAAPEALAGLPAPTHVFIGGSSGRMREILLREIGMNPDVRIVVNAVTLETLAETMRCIAELGLRDDEVVCVNVSRARKVGGYRMMTAANPVHIISCRGPGA
jgi:precorrin-6Y C5,15-methyltransferase (decarboxylating)